MGMGVGWVEGNTSLPKITACVMHANACHCLLTSGSTQAYQGENIHKFMYHGIIHKCSVDHMARLHLTFIKMQNVDL